jgi:hypothetical protein
MTKIYNNDNKKYVMDVKQLLEVTYMVGGTVIHCNIVGKSSGGFFLIKHTSTL